MTLENFKKLIDELYETNNFGYDDFDVSIRLGPDEPEPSVMRIDLIEKVIEIE